MRNNIQKKGLLEKISVLAGCTYLSDLHCYQPLYSASIQKAVGQLKGDDYSLEEWMDTVCYITGRAHKFASVEAAVSFLEQYLNR